MNCKDYIYKAHHGFIISYDEFLMLDDIPADMKQRGNKEYTVENCEYQRFVDSMDSVPDFNKPFNNASGLGRPLGTKNTWDGETFDSKWEYAFYRYQKDIKGAVIKRNHSEWYPYYDSLGKQRRFYYDFTVNNQPFEVKGIFHDLDYLKQQATYGIVTFVTDVDIKPMMKELDAKIPTWRNDCIEL